MGNNPQSIRSHEESKKHRDKVAESMTKMRASQQGAEKVRPLPLFLVIGSP